MSLELLQAIEPGHPASIIQTWLQRSLRTRIAYASDLRAWSDFAGVTPVELLEQLLACGAPAYLQLVCTYAAQASLAGSTLRRRVAALRSLLRIGQVMRGQSWAIPQVDLPPCAEGRRGPSKADLAKVLATCAGSTVEELRDSAIIRLLWSQGYRRAEVCGLDLADFDQKQWVMRVRGKGGKVIEDPIGLRVGHALGQWLYARRCFLAIQDRNRELNFAALDSIARAVQPNATLDSMTPALFLRLDRAACPPYRLSPASIWRMLARRSESAGVGQIRPHGIRHAATTEALDQTDGNVRRVAAWTRHADIATVQRYDDKRRENRGQISELLASLLGESV